MIGSYSVEMASHLRVAGTIFHEPSLTACAFDQHFSLVTSNLISSSVDMTFDSVKPCHSSVYFYKY